MSSHILLSSDNLHVEFGGVKAADGVDLQLYRGQIASIIGPNGSGKTTFLNLCTGYVRPTQGRVIFGGKDLTKMAPRTITRLGVARTFQLPQLFSEQSILENLLLALAARDGFWTLATLHREKARHEAEELLNIFGLLDKADRLIGSLPEGVRKLVDIAVALALSPSLLLMDEPTSGVSSQEKFEIMDMLIPVLRNRGITALLVEHDMELVERYMDRVIVWNAGQVVADGPPAEILLDEEVLRNVIGGA
jgi:branched-chain amino acid transport system ATP-binding protein